VRYLPKIWRMFHLKGKIHKFLYLAIFFSITPATLAASLLAVNMLSHSKYESQKVKQQELAQIQYPNLGANVYASLPNTIGEVKGIATAQDARYEIVHQYLVKYNSPLIPHTQFIIDTSEKYTLDFRLIVAIAQQESNLCKKIPENSHNCWGWGIHSRGTLMFDSYEEAIEAVSKGLKEEYLDKGYTTPEQIMAKYTPSSPGTWAKGVSQFLQDME
jgi:hypothetical protein